MKSNLTELVRLRNNLAASLKETENLIQMELVKLGLRLGNNPGNKKFPVEVRSISDKLRYILKHHEAVSSKEIKDILWYQYGEYLPNVDQILVNLEKKGDIKSKGDNPKVYYKP